MNEKQARLEGLSFTGAAAHPWESKELKDLKEEAKQIRRLGFRAVVVSSGRNEWGAGS